MLPREPRFSASGPFAGFDLGVWRRAQFLILPVAGLGLLEKVYCNAPIERRWAATSSA
jgi:hypothetical protein